MQKNRAGVIALQEIYRYEIDKFKILISGFADDSLTEITDGVTTNKNCVSRQAIIAHTISAGYTYATYIRETKDAVTKHPGNILYDSVCKFIAALDEMFAYTEKALDYCDNDDLYPTATSQKINAHWDKAYDVEQMLEHAIVHVMRHRRQLQ